VIDTDLQIRIRNPLDIILEEVRHPDRGRVTTPVEKLQVKREIIGHTGDKVAGKTTGIGKQPPEPHIVALVQGHQSGKAAGSRCARQPQQAVCYHGGDYTTPMQRHIRPLSHL